MAPRKVLSLGPDGLRNWPNSKQSYTDQGSRLDVLATNTPWVRLWAEWPILQPNKPDPTNPDPNKRYPLGSSTAFANLDQAVTAANNDQRLVILVVWRTPTWEWGGPPQQPGQPPIEQGVPLPGQYLEATGKQWGYRVPNDLTINGPWAKFLLYVMYRYHPSNPQRGGIAHAVEVCNEPNYQMWPQDPTPNPDPAATTFIINATAQMMQTAQAAKYVWGLKGAGPLLLAPGTSDHDTTDKDATTGYVQHTDYGSFTSKLLQKLNDSGFYPDTEYAWSHHNYLDMEGYPDQVTGQGPGAPRAANARAKLVQYGWAGWPRADKTAPILYLTEGGVRMAHANYDHNAQQGLFDSNYTAITSGSQAAGISMLTWYTVWGDPVATNDCGLIDPAGGFHRAMYQDWTSIDQGLTSLSHWHGWEDLGGGLVGGVDACSWGSGRFDVFCRGTSPDRGVFHKWFDGAWHPSKTGDWEYMNGQSWGDPTATSWGNGRIDLFVNDLNNTQCLHRWFANGAWSPTPWEVLGGTFTSGLDSCSWGSGRLDVFGLGADYRLWHKWYSGGWGPGQYTWESLGAPPVGTLSSDPAAVSWGNGHLDVFVRGASSSGVPNQGIWHRYFYNGAWSGWDILVDGQQIDTAPDAASWAPGRIDLFWLRNGELRHKWYDSGAGQWFTSETIGASVNGNPGAASWGSGRVDVFARSSSGSCSHTWYE